MLFISYLVKNSRTRKLCGDVQNLKKNKNKLCNIFILHVTAVQFHLSGKFFFKIVQRPYFSRNYSRRRWCSLSSTVNTTKMHWRMQDFRTEQHIFAPFLAFFLTCFYLKGTWSVLWPRYTTATIRLRRFTINYVFVTMKRRTVVCTNKIQIHANFILWNVFYVKI